MPGPIPVLAASVKAEYASGSSGDLLPPSPPAEKATAGARQSSTDDGAGGLSRLRCRAVFGIKRRSPRTLTRDKESPGRAGASRF